MKFNREKMGRRWIPYTIATCSAVVLYLALSHLDVIGRVIAHIFHFIAPVFWGAVIAYIVDALVTLLQRSVFRPLRNRRAGRVLSIILAIVLILALAALLSVALVPQLVESVTSFFANLGGYANSLRRLLETTDIEIAGYRLDLSGALEYGDTLLQNLIKTVQDNAGRILNTSYNIGIGFVNTGISFILAVYFLLDKEKLQRLAKRILRLRLTPERYQSVTLFCSRCNHILIRFLSCDLLDGLIVGVANFLFMTATGMPYSVLISVVVGVTNLLPTFGPIVGGAIGAFILLLVHPQYVLWFLIFTVILQTIDGYIIKPKLYGDQLGISPLWVLVTIVVGGRMFGTAGVVLAIPFAAISSFLFHDIAWDRLRARQRENREKKPVSAAKKPAESSAEPPAETPPEKPKEATEKPEP